MGEGTPRIDALYHHRKFSMARDAGVELIQWFSEHLEALWELILSKVASGPWLPLSPAPTIDSVIMSANSGINLPLERAGYRVAEHLEPGKRWALRTGDPCREGDRGALLLYDAGSLRYALEHR